MEKQAGLRGALLEEAKQVRPSPGVYLMQDGDGNVLYVGKAKILPNRLASYFQAGPHELARTEMLVNRIARFDVILTETEAEALILECALIKKHRPKFNIRLKDDKAYPYIKIQVQDDFPRLEWTRRVLKDGARYFGPFPSAWAARQVMVFLIEMLQLRDCSDNTFRHRSRPCLLHQIGRCKAPCVGYISQRDYREAIDQVIAILEGKTDSLVKTLRREMDGAAEREEYEKAAFYRDQLRNLELVTETQGAQEAGSQRDRDVMGISRREADAHGTVLKIRGGKLIAVQHYHLQNTDVSNPDAEILFEFLSQYYVMAQEAGESVPSEVLVQSLPDDVDLLEGTLGVSVRFPETPVDGQLLNVARANAEYALEQSLKSYKGCGIEALEEVQEKLHLQRLPHRIECYDISNIQGQDAVASRVVFVDGRPDKNLYRRYKIKTVDGANDFAMMKEVLFRRFSNAEEELPDLVVVDGGKGQLSQAVVILEELSVQGVGVVGLAKARTESDFLAKEVKSTLERIFIPNRKNPVPLLPHTAAYRLLTQVRDEAHRFAIAYHRLLRNKRSLRSVGEN